MAAADGRPPVGGVGDERELVGEGRQQPPAAAVGRRGAVRVALWVVVGKGSAFGPVEDAFSNSPAKRQARCPVERAIQAIRSGWYDALELIWL